MAALIWAEQVAGSRAAAADVPAADDFVSVVVELSAAPAVEVYAALPPPADQVAAAQRSAATQAQVAAIDQAQLATQAALEELGAQTLYRTQRVYNGIAVRVPRERLDAVRALPGVEAVHPLIAKQPANQVSVPSIGAPAVWGGLPGITGRGVTIAIIDTGVDYVHPDLGGPGTGYGQNDPARVGDVPGFPNDKVIAGYDFAGDDYNADPRSAAYQPVPQPDPDPMDCYGFGHGTHVAGTAAGYGVLPDGARYPGPYDATTPQRAFQIGPGVAPEASIVALKVFGCHGSSEIVDRAIEWAVDPNGDGDFSDRVDVINLSLGSPLGAADDPTAVAANNAARLGVIVVTSAGNSGDTYYAISSPSVAERVISVAAVGRELPAQVADFSARGPRRGDAAPKPELAAPGEGIVSARLGGGTHTASGTSMAAPHVAGAMALLRQLHPLSPVTAALRPATGNASASVWTVEELKALAMNTAVYPVTTPVSGGIVPVSPVRAGAGRIDLAATAQAEVIAYNADVPGLVGVGFGAPEVLVRLSSVRNVRVANKGTMTATYAVTYAPVVDLPGVTIDVMGSSTITVPPGGFAAVSVIMTAEADKMQHNRDPALAVEQSGLPRAWLAEEAGYLELSPTAASLNAAGAHPPLHVPVYAAPRPASQLTADGTLLDFGDADTGQAMLRFAGQALHGSSPPTGVVSLAGLLELQHLSGLEPPPEGSTRQYLQADLHYVGVAAVQPTAPSGGDDAVILFGVATHEPWDTPHAVRFHIYIDTDLDGEADYRLRNSDAVDDDAQRTIDEVFLAVLETWPARARVAQEFLNGASAAELDTALHNTRLMVLPARASALGLGNGVTRFSYSVESYALDISDALRRGIAIERTPVYHYDVSNPGLRFPAGLGSTTLHGVDSGTSIAVGFDRAAYQRAGTRGLLVFHLHNLDEARAQLVPVSFVARSSLYLPLVRR